MADQTRCPTCRGGKALFYTEGPSQCPACGGTGEKEVDDGLLTAQSGEGPAGSSPAVSADLIDRVTDLLNAASEPECLSALGSRRYEDQLHAQACAVISLLVEHGRQQEREKWETRIREEAEVLEGRAEVSYTVGENQAAVRYEADARVLRSLLTGEGEE